MLAQSRWGMYSLLCLLAVPVGIAGFMALGVVEAMTRNFGGMAFIEFLLIACIPLFLILGIVFGVMGVYRDAHVMRAKVAIVLNTLILASLFIGLIVSMNYTINEGMNAIRQGNPTSQSSQ